MSTPCATTAKMVDYPTAHLDLAATRSPESETPMDQPTSGHRPGDPDPDGPATMRAVVQDRYGSLDVLTPAVIARPRPGEHEVLLRVHAAGLDRGTWHLMTGKPYLMRVIGFGLRRPKNRVPGLDVAGTVAAVGPAVTRFSVGDEVYGVARGSFAEYAAAHEDKLARKPANISFEQAAVVPVSGLIAQRGLVDVGHLRGGQQVLITGASGGVGSYAVQLAKSLGAEVTAVASSGKADLVRSLGADHVIDYTREDFADGTRRYDLILDIAGNPTLARLRRALTPHGTAVILGGEQGGGITGGFGRTLRAPLLSPFVSQRLTMVAAKENGRDLQRLTALIEAGQLTPHIDRTYPLEDVSEAMARLVAGDVGGKVAISV
jgi:NADPH:quinone reductase-like Zn-dependent oxidoreductase